MKIVFTLRFLVKRLRKLDMMEKKIYKIKRELKQIHRRVSITSSINQRIVYLFVE
jgi:hypothetical protein